MRDQRKKDGTRGSFQIGGVDRTDKTPIAAAKREANKAKEASTSRPAAKRQRLELIEVSINPADIKIEVININLTLK
jgi:hypothetical protein